MIAAALLLATPATTATFLPSQTADIAKVATLLAELEKGAAAFEGIRFEGLENNEAVDLQDFIAFAKKCPVEQLNGVPSSPIRQPVFVSWDCHNSRKDAARKPSDNPKAAFFFDGDAITLIKFGVPEVITVGGGKASPEKPIG